MSHLPWLLAALGALVAAVSFGLSPWPWTAGLPVAALLLYAGLSAEEQDAETPPN